MLENVPVRDRMNAIWKGKSDISDPAIAIAIGREASAEALTRTFVHHFQNSKRSNLQPAAVCPRPMIQEVSWFGLPRGATSSRSTFQILPFPKSSISHQSLETRMER